MKKSLVAAGVIVALGVVWTGGAWYTGKKLETHLAEMVSQANAQIKLTAPEANVELAIRAISVASSAASYSWCLSR